MCIVVCRNGCLVSIFLQNYPRIEVGGNGVGVYIPMSEWRRKRKKDIRLFGSGTFTAEVKPTTTVTATGDNDDDDDDRCLTLLSLVFLCTSHNVTIIFHHHYIMAIHEIPSANLATPFL